MSVSELVGFVGITLFLLALLLMILFNWWQDYKKWKFHKNRPRIMNPWSDW